MHVCACVYMYECMYYVCVCSVVLPVTIFIRMRSDCAIRR